MVVTDCDIKPIYNKQNPRKVYLFSEANWEEIYSACERLSLKIQNMINMKDTIEHIWTTFESEIQSAMDTFIPSKTFKKNNTVPWFNRKLKKCVDGKPDFTNMQKRVNNGWNLNNIRNFAKKNSNKLKLTT